MPGVTQSMSEPQKIYESEMEEIWGTLLDADMQMRYWRCCVQQRQNLDLAFKIAIALLSSGTVATWLISATNQAVWKTLSALAAIVAIIHPLLNLSRDIEEMTGLHGKWVRLLYDYEDLFQSLKDTDRKEVLENYRRLRSTEVDLQERSVRLGINENLKRKCFSKVCASRNLTDPFAKKGK